MENTISFGIQLSVLAISLLATIKLIYKNLMMQTVSIVIVHLDQDNKYIAKTTIKESVTTEEIELDTGYRLNHYEWNSSTNTLFLFLKPHSYNDFYDGRNRQIILPHIFYPVKIKENYHKEEVS